MIRAVLSCALALLCAPALADEPGVQPLVQEEPRLSRQPAASKTSKTSKTSSWRRERGPRLKLGYRTFSIGDQGGRDARYHCFEVNAYVYSGILRAGAGLEAGTDDTPRGDFTIASVLGLGVQYPGRLTPFVDFLLGLGVLRRDVLHQDLVGFAYHVGLEAGGELFLGGFMLSTSIGWRRQVFRHGENDQVEAVYVHYDSFTAKVGFGF